MTKIPNAFIPSINNLGRTTSSLTQALDLAGMRTLRSAPMRHPRLMHLGAGNQQAAMSGLRSSSKPPRAFSAEPLPRHALTLARSLLQQCSSKNEYSAFAHGQGRGKFTLVAAQIDNHRLSRVLETPELKTLLKDAAFVGLHATNDVNVQGMQKSGINFDLTGENWGSYSSMGPGLYTTKEPRLAMWYGLHAATRNPDSQPQMLAVFRLPSSEKVIQQSLRQIQADPENAGQVHEIGRTHKYAGEYVETKITPAGINSPHIEYVAVALPKFEAMKVDDITAQLEEFVKKMSAG